MGINKFIQSVLFGLKNKQLKTMKQLFLFLALCLCSVLSFGATYYVSYSAGNDANTAAQAQSSTTPWKTLDKILANLNNGTIAANSIILLKRGDAWLIPFDFNPAKALIFDSYGPGNIKPYVTSLISVPSNRWTLKDATLGIWETTDVIQAPRSNSINMVVVNGKSYAMGRTPNDDRANKGWLNYDSHTSTSITDGANPIAGDNSFAGSQIVVRTSHYTLERGTITSVSGTTINFSTSGWKTGMGSDQYGYFVQNNYKCLDKFGEWFYNTSTKKLDVCLGPLNNPAAFNIQYPSIDTLIQPKASNITFKNLQITGGNRFILFNDYGSISNIWARSCDFAYSGGDLICFKLKTYVGVDSCTGRYANSNGFFFDFHVNSAYVNHCYIRDIGNFPGMFFINSSAKYGNGVYYGNQNALTDTGLTARYNELHNIGYAGFDVWGNNDIMEYNFIDTCTNVLDDAGGIYFYNYASSGTTPKTLTKNYIRYNIILHSLGAAEGTPPSSPGSAPGNGIGAQGIYLDDNSNHVTVFGNTMAYSQFSGLYMHNTNRCRVENNVMFDNFYCQHYMQDDGIGDSIYLDTIRYNVLMPLNNTQLVYYFGLSNTAGKDSKNFDTWGIIDNNTLAMPFSTNVVLLNHFGGVLFKTYTLPQWQSTWHYDVNSAGMPFSISNLNQINFVYNSSHDNSLDFSFPCDNYISVTDTTYINKITLKPLASNVLLLPNP